MADTTAETQRDPQESLAAVFDWMADRYLWQTRLVSWGRYEAWQKQLAKAIAEVAPNSLVDIGSGPGRLLELVSQDLPGCRLAAVDISSAMLDRIPHAFGVEKYQSPLADWAPEHPGQFDAAVLSFVVRDTDQWPETIQQAARVVRPGGHVFILETHTPKGRSARGFRWYFFGMMPRLGRRVLAKDWPGPAPLAPYQWLADSHRRWNRGEALPEWMEAAGLTPRRHTAPSDVVVLWSGQKAKA